MVKFMIPAPHTDEELKRLQALDESEFLDTPSEAKFDFITDIVSRICNCPIALVSLVDKDWQWFKSKVGLDVCETSREIAFYAYTILQDRIFEIQDTQLDHRFFDNPLVIEEPMIRFYAGVPIVWNDLNIGTLCVIDKVPKKLSQEQKDCLQRLAIYIGEVILNPVLLPICVNVWILCFVRR